MRCPFPALLCLIPFVHLMGQEPVDRKILAVYKSSEGSPGSRYTDIHRAMEMPLNHLGLVVTYHDIRETLPPVSSLGGIRGVLVSLMGGTAPDPKGFLDWLDQVCASGVKLIIMGQLGLDDTVHLGRIKRIYRYIGMEYTGDWVRFTYNMDFVRKESELVEFERKLAGSFTPFTRMTVFDARVTPLLVGRLGGDPTTDSVLVATHPNGAFVTEGYFYYTDRQQRQQLYINPFAFFGNTLQTDELPKPDSSTLVGRRIFYSHIDGDGWNNISEIEPYRRNRIISAEVVRQEIVEVFDDLPVTVAPIAGDLDPKWHGSEKSMSAARNLFLLNNVETASHTYSHPLYWYFFDTDDPDKELPYLPQYKKANWKHKLKSISRQELQARKEKLAATSGMEGYETPRVYAVEPFDLELEITGSIKLINSLAPRNKKAELIQWSGDTTVFPAALERTRALGLRNINGGDTRFDREYPSYSMVAPVGWQVGNSFQIYASNSNENTYTDLWTDRFFGFVHLTKTLRNTETPYRIKPLNVYYHMYSGEKVASLRAVVRNLEYARSKEITPIMTSQYAAIADGFFSTRIEKLGKDHWRFRDRDQLQTIRFDRASRKALDLAGSKGVLGQRHFQGSLYVALDPAEALPEIRIRPFDGIGRLPTSPLPYLVHSRWPIRNLERTSDGFSFQAGGYGAGNMVWMVPTEGRWSVRVVKEGKTVFQAAPETMQNGSLEIHLPRLDGQHRFRVARKTSQ